MPKNIYPNTDSVKRHKKRKAPFVKVAVGVMLFHNNSFVLC